MYQYSAVDQNAVEARVKQFREQLERYQEGLLPEDSFKTLRLQNGVYIQTHAPMLRVAIPYGTLSSIQLRKLAYIARTYDKGYGHFTTRQNIQFNWPTLESVPDILEELSVVQMHAIQTSGNCVRNTTTDPFAGATVNEAIDPRVICELIRQWSTFHPEYAYLPRKFKIAVVATELDRAAIEVHDIGIRLKRHSIHGLAFDLWVGGGLGRTPVIGKLLFADLPFTELRNWLNAVLRIYNLYGRRDNKYKARIKILVNSVGLSTFRELVSNRYHKDRNDALVVKSEDVTTLASMFQVNLQPEPEEYQPEIPEFYRWYKNATKPHRVNGYRLVVISLKRPDVAPGDLSAELMDVVASLADRFSQSEIRTTHDQNLVLPHVHTKDLFSLWEALSNEGLAHPNVGLISDVIACPGLDFCSLANAPTLSLADAIHQEFASLAEQENIGPLEIKISGCMNACGHHHIGHIGILGVDKKGTPWYQLTVGGRDQKGAVLGERIGPAVEHDEVIPLIRRIIDRFMEERAPNEWFVDYVTRIGIEPLKEAAYAIDYA
jgi:sulfite reductase (NADPH) hemoprotein beta-component